MADNVSKTQTTSIQEYAKKEIKPPFTIDKVWTKQGQRAGSIPYSSINDNLSKITTRNTGTTNISGGAANNNWQKQNDDSRLNYIQPFRVYAQAMAQTPGGPPNHFCNLLNDNAMNCTPIPPFMDITGSLISEVPSYFSSAARTNMANAAGTTQSFIDKIATISTPS